MIHLSLSMNLISHQSHPVIFGLALQLMIIVPDHPIVLHLLLHHLVRVHLALMLPCSVQFTLQKIFLLSIHNPFSIVLKGLGLVLLEMDLVDTVLLRIVQFIISLQEEVLQRQSHHRILEAIPHFILMVEIGKLQRLGSSYKGSQMKSLEYSCLIGVMPGIKRLQKRKDQRKGE
uniref:Uncharacterized protein n=1 Tax=Nomascus leucogenys TaxID=61853 RepID=A0A2I3GPU1_NOMLE